MVILLVTAFIANGKFYAMQTQLAKTYDVGNGICRKKMVPRRSCTKNVWGQLFGLQ